MNYILSQVLLMTESFLDLNLLSKDSASSILNASAFFDAP